MGTTKKEAYAILELTPDCKLRDIERNYKRLALEWYPQKHNYSALSNEKFKNISHAYKILTSQEKKVYDLTMSEMMSLFQQVFFKSSGASPEDDYEDDSDYSDYNDSFDDTGSEDCEVVTPKYETLIHHSLQGTINKYKQSKEKALKNAEELIAEEEKEKKKAEKRRAKKKRRKQKKKQEKVSTTNEEPKKTESEKSNDDQKIKESQSSGSEEEHLDPTSAFVAGAAGKTKINAIAQKLRRNEPIVPTMNGNAQNQNVKVEDIDPVTLRSRQLAIKGNQMAAMAEYQAAIDLFTEAIKLDPTDFRYFGNRSYCYDRTDQYNRALKDADRAIVLAPNWPKGYFRKGRALAGLQRFAEAEECFKEVTKLDKDCAEAYQEMYKARTLRIMEMGFSRQVAEVAAQKYDTLQAAVDALVAESSSLRVNSRAGSSNGVTPLMVAGRASLNGDESSDIYISDDEQEEYYSKSRSNSAQAADDKMDPRNPHKQTSLWVGNVKKETTEKTLSALFAKFGEVVSIRVLPDRRCAFVNYKNPRAASRAMEEVQGFEFLGENLKIRFPDHQHGIGQSTVTVLKKKTSVAKTKPKGSTVEFKGPVNGDECFFWRQGGCIHGEKCKYRHVPKHKGIDLK